MPRVKHGHFGVFWERFRQCSWIYFINGRGVKEYMYIYIYIYIERERDRERKKEIERYNIYIYPIYIY